MVQVVGEGNVAEWSARRTSNKAVPGSSPHWSLAGFISATLVNSQLVCLRPVAILMFVAQSAPLAFVTKTLPSADIGYIFYICFSSREKLPCGVGGHLDLSRRRFNTLNVSQLPITAFNCIVNGTTPKRFLSKWSTPEFACEKLKLTCLAPFPDCPVCRRWAGL